MRTVSHYPAALVAVLLTLLLAMTACSAPDGDSGGGGPIQINTPQGQVVVNGTPKRIVTLGGQWIDTALAFGVKPVAYLDQSQILTKKPAPWVGDKLAGSTQLNLENLVAEIAKAKPDLILAEGFMATAQPETFAKIREIAPTVPGVTGKQVDPWQDLVTLFGTVTRQPDKAKEIIDGVNAKVTKIATDLPGLKGKTYALAYMFSSEQIQVMADPTDGAGEVMASLGLVVAPKLAAEAKKQNQSRFPISTENVPMLDADLLVITASNDNLQKQLEKLAGYSTLKSVKSGALADLSVAEITGLNTPTPLSVPYVLNVMYPALQKASGN
ncbi:MAG: ABC transporter substrate-binding protein [Gordonia sp. (in: high G+C Gram-positive bacteria)]